MELFEHQAKRILQRFGIPFSPYYIVDSIEDIELLVKKNAIEVAEISSHRADVQVANSASEVVFCAKNCKAVDGRKIMIVPRPRIAKTYAVCVAIEGSVVVVTCSQQRDNRSPLVVQEEITDWNTLFPFQVNRLISAFTLSGPCTEQFRKILSGAIHAFFRLDAMRLELSSVVLTEYGSFETTGAFVTVDPYAFFRQPELSLLLPAREVSFLPLDGSIGCLSNGKALGLATVDVLTFCNMAVAGLFDIGTEFVEATLRGGLTFLQQQPSVQKIMVHLFTGLKDCETVANGITREVATWKAMKPMCIFFQGTNASGGVRALRDKKLPLYGSTSLDDVVKHLRGL